MPAIFAMAYHSLVSSRGPVSKYFSRIGETLLKECIALAKKLNYKEILLDTLKRLQPAIKLYKKYNFIETEAYYKNPNNDVVYMKLVL